MKLVRLPIIILLMAVAAVSGRGLVHASGGQFTTIDDPNARTQTYANGINSQGDIAGDYADTTTHTFRGFLLTHG